MATAASFTVLQAVDGVTLRYAVDAWVSAPPSQRAAFAAAEAVRWTEIVMNALSYFLAGLSLFIYGLAIAPGRVYPRWAGMIAVLSGATLMYNGAVEVAYEGFVASVVEESRGTSSRTPALLQAPPIACSLRAGCCHFIHRVGGERFRRLPQMEVLVHVDQGGLEELLLTDAPRDLDVRDPWRGQQMPVERDLLGLRRGCDQDHRGRYGDQSDDASHDVSPPFPSITTHVEGGSDDDKLGSGAWPILERSFCLLSIEWPRARF